MTSVCVCVFVSLRFSPYTLAFILEEVQKRATDEMIYLTYTQFKTENEAPEFCAVCCVFAVSCRRKGKSPAAKRDIGIGRSTDKYS